jgi:MFS family permease
VYHTLALRYIVLTTAVALLVIGFTETLIFAVVAQGLHRPPSFLGILESAQGVGAIAGGLTAGMALRRFGDVRLVALGLALFGIGDAFLVSTSLPLILGGIAVAGWGLPWAIVALGTALQRRTPADLQGRVASAADTLIGTPQIFSVALGAALSTVVDYRILVTVVCIVVLACGIFLFAAPAQARLPASGGGPSDLAVAR